MKFSILLFALFTSTVFAANFKDVEVRGRARVQGADIVYTARNGRLAVAAGADRANLEYTAYLSGSNSRPVTFVFNGGPGASTMWLQMGMMGPRLVDLGSSGLEMQNPTRVIDNENFPIDVTDIVLVNTVGAGWSQAVRGTKASAFHNQDQDAAILHAFVVAFVEKFSRENSPIYLMGESYGGVRASMLADSLQARAGLKVDGVYLISPSFEAERKSAESGLLEILSLFPSLVVTAAYHGKGDFTALSPEQLFARGQSFVRTELRPALEKGDALPAAELRAVAAKAAAFTGLAEEILVKAGLKISLDLFITNFTGKDGEILAYHEGRMPRSLVAKAIQSFYEGAQSHLLGDLGLQRPIPYRLNADIKTWSVNPEQHHVTAHLARALAAQPSLQVTVAGGYYDLVCPIAGQEEAVSRLTAEQQARVKRIDVEGGHMVYMNTVEVRARLAKSFRELVRGTSCVRKAVGG